MKIVSRNCNMAFRNKEPILRGFNADIIVLQECENQDAINSKNTDIKYSDYIRYGKNKNKGLGVMTFNGYKAELLDHNPDLQYILPVKVQKGDFSCTLLIVRTQLVDKDIYKSYIVQAIKAIKYYKQLLEDENIIIIGDFNSNAIWDKQSPKEFNHNEMVCALENKGILSVYHFLNREPHGKEQKSTLYFRKNSERGYHIDYIFIKQKLLENIKSFEIGDYNKYIKHSDHMPLFIDINNH